jgi:hypothetical protein
MFFATFSAEAPPVIVPDTLGTFQLYTILSGTIPFNPLVGVTANGKPLHIVVLIVTTSGVGVTNTVTVNIAPSQLPAFGITSYVAVRVVFVRFNKRPDIVVATFAADSPPVIVPEYVGIPQRYIVGFGTIPFVKLVGVTANIAPLHIVVLIALTSGVGFTNTVTVNIAPSQLPDVGITS